jgi:hypothetical protein
MLAATVVVMVVIMMYYPVVVVLSNSFFYRNIFSYLINARIGSERTRTQFRLIRIIKRLPVDTAALIFFLHTRSFTPQDGFPKGISQTNLGPANLPVYCRVKSPHFV